VLKAFILIETSIGAGPRLVDSLRAIQEVRSADRVAGPYGVIAVVEIADLEALRGLLEDRIRTLPEVEKTVTCIAVPQ